MEEHRGKHRVDLWKTNRIKIEEWMKNNPGETMKSCSKSIGLCYITTRQHIKALRLQGKIK